MVDVALAGLRTGRLPARAFHGLEAPHAVAPERAHGKLLAQRAQERRRLGRQLEAAVERSLASDRALLEQLGPSVHGCPARARSILRSGTSHMIATPA